MSRPIAEKEQNEGRANIDVDNNDNPESAVLPVQNTPPVVSASRMKGRGGVQLQSLNQHQPPQRFQLRVKMQLLRQPLMKIILKPVSKLSRLPKL